VIDTYLRQFETAAANGAGGAPDWLKGIRQGAMDGFLKTGFPSTRDEEWRFTPVTPITRGGFAASAVPATLSLADLSPYLFGHPEWPRLVFVDGQFDPALSSVAGQAGLSVTTIRETLEADPQFLERNFGRHVRPEETPFTALNTALARDGAVIRASRGIEVAVPVHVLFVSSAAVDVIVTHPRVLVVADEQSRLQVVESYVSLSNRTRYWTNAVAEVSMGPGSWVEHGRIQRESEAAYHIGFTHVTQARDSHYRSFSLAMGGAIARHNLQARLGAPNTEALLYGLYIGRGDQLIDNHTTIYHDEPNCRSWEVYKGVLDDRAHGVFNGKIFVTPEAQKTDAKQTNRALLLSDAARVDTKPQLEIFADDVKCTHGATIGNLDPMWSFYCQSRGIPSDTARRILTHAFAAEVLNEVTSEPIRAALNQVVHERLGVAR